MDLCGPIQVCDGLFAPTLTPTFLGCLARDQTSGEGAKATADECHTSGHEQARTAPRTTRAHIHREACLQGQPQAREADPITALTTQNPRQRHHRDNGKHVSGDDILGNA
jgi:hypothetical protein